MSEIALTLIETTISTKTVRMRLASDQDATKAIEWLEFQVIPDEYVYEDHKRSENPDRVPLAATRLAALRRARDVIAA